MSASIEKEGRGEREQMGKREREQMGKREIFIIYKMEKWMTLIITIWKGRRGIKF